MPDNLRAATSELDSILSLLESIEGFSKSELVGQNLLPAVKHLAAARASLGLATLAAEQESKK